MDYEKIKRWLAITRDYQENDFWTKIFAYNTPEQFFENRQSNTLPKYDLYQNETHVCVIIELPGITSKDVNVSLNSDTYLLVRGNFPLLFPNEMEITKERYYGTFERLIPLPEPTELHLLQINHHNGLFQITYPKKIQNMY